METSERENDLGLIVLSGLPIERVSTALCVVSVQKKLLLLLLFFPYLNSGYDHPAWAVPE